MYGLYHIVFLTLEATILDSQPSATKADAPPIELPSWYDTDGDRPMTLRLKAECSTD